MSGNHSHPTSFCLNLSSGYDFIGPSYLQFIPSKGIQPWDLANSLIEGRILRETKRSPSVLCFITVLG